MKKGSQSVAKLIRDDDDKGRRQTTNECIQTRTSVLVQIPLQRQALSANHEHQQQTKSRPAGTAGQGTASSGLFCSLVSQSVQEHTLLSSGRSCGRVQGQTQNGDMYD